MTTNSGSGLAPTYASLAAAITALIFVVALVGGKKWWSFEETDFRRHLREGAWPDLAAEVRVEGSQRILRLTLGNKAFATGYSIPLVPDHGKPRGLGKGRGSIEILCSDEELFQLGAGEPWDAGA